MIKRRQVEAEAEAEEGIEMNSHTRTSVSGVRHTTTESKGDSMYIHAELAAYLESDFNGSHSQSLARDPDAGPALAYRQAHRIK
jgi:hypothetical protein